MDHHGAREIMGELERNIETSLPRVLELDLGGVTFMDSSGIAVLLRAYRRLGALGGEVRVHNVPPQAARVLRAAGLDKLIRLPGRLGIPIFAITVGAAGSGPHGRFLYI